ncbi:hypothetical protein [Cellulomonas sp. C5510]|uniref:hypothetical protein n=1 Tax=Cellulomonas sp. C5510 TaxID=2871170 RepID=UPI001C981ACE|nr:hypothetical protein [Cellulomonas sp. C5510]QZN84972.1 hypothetical protein K5O09_14365 [Cellulomonas sp. C5510]
MSGETRGDGGTGSDDPAGPPLDGAGTLGAGSSGAGSSGAGSSGAGVPGTVGPGADGPGTTTGPGTWPALPGGAPPDHAAGTSPVPAVPTPDAAPVGPGAPDHAEQERFDADGRPLDPRAIARASLDADRNWSLWVISLAVVLSVSLAVVAGTAVGALALAAFLACCAVVRGVVRGGPAALVVRSRATDVTVLAGLAVTIAVLSQVVPVPAP